MELKPSKGQKVVVGAPREAVFGEEGVEVRKVSFHEDGARNGVLTGLSLAGYCEVEMPRLDGRKHWYPIDSIQGENGEKVVEEAIEIDEESESTED